MDIDVRLQHYAKLVAILRDENEKLTNALRRLANPGKDGDFVDMTYLPDPLGLPIAERIEDQATRAARLVRQELDWGDADKALVRARELLKKWAETQPHPHG